MDISLFSTHRAPFYILAPDFRHSSAGVRNLHYLCHALNELGYEAYIAGASKTSPHLRTPLLDISTMERHFRADLLPIAVYPEITSGNPLNLPVVARWLLNVPGHLGGEDTYSKNDLIFYHLPWCLPASMSGTQLYIPSVNTHIFNNDENPLDEKRSGFCRYAHKFLGFGGKIKPEHEAFRSLGHEITLRPEDIASILRSSEALYCYERSAIIQEAIACGCPVLCVSSEYWDIQPLEVFEPGIEMDLGTESLAKAKAEIGNYADNLRSYQAHSIEQIRQLAEQSQAQVKKIPTSTTRASLLAANHQYWLLNTADRLHYIEAFRYFYANIPELSTSQDGLAKNAGSVSMPGKTKLPGPNIFSRSNDWLLAREWITSNSVAIHPRISSLEKKTAFHFILRLHNELNLLADTLDSLNNQLLSDWALDVFSPFVAPDVVNEIPIIRWHTVSNSQSTHHAIDEVCAETASDWIIELPPGAVLDHMFLWRLTDEINRHPNARAFFFDDFITENGQVCIELRLKPGVNPAALQSSDTAGPLCISKKTWFSIEGTSELAGSPWFAQLLRISEKFGWSSIRHIPDALISYPDTFPTNTEACLLSLYQHLNKESPGSEVLAATGQSWRIRYPLSSTPRVSIAVVSSNQPDLLRRCLESIAQKTSYPDFEIFLQLTPEERCERFIAEWITQQQDEQKTQLTIVDRLETDGLSAQCNRVAQLIHGDFVAIVRDDAVIIQPEWLEELVRTALQKDIALVAPRLIRAGDAKISSVGQVLGLRGTLGSPYANEATLEDNGYLDHLQIARDVSSVSNACVLFKKTSFDAVGGIDENLPDPNLAWSDFCLKVLAAGHRLLCQPLATVVDGDIPALDLEADFELHHQKMQAKAQGEQLFNQRWLAAFPADPFWNPNLSLHSEQVIPETDYLPQWHYLPGQAYRIFARPITGAQATYRITSPLQALVNTGKVAQCVWPMGNNPRDELSIAEMARLAADSVIVQNYIHDHHLAALENWRRLPNRPFTVYALDDLITRMADNSHFRKNFPVNSASRLKFALERCDRLVVSTEFLAEVYAGLCKDIRVVPNRLESELWLPLASRKRTSKKPRIGWAGGSGHFYDLVLLKEVIERTRDEADWIFFGMCPDEIRPLLTEFHGLEQLTAYPAKLASLNLDIAVAPLEQIPFNQAKSNLRLLEYGILGIPVVCTDIAPYRNSPAHRVANTTDAWVSILREWISAPDAREREGANLRRWVRQNYLLENHLDEWLSAHKPA
jgi:GT2 family glycosyltransferase/glycosyltransferase involved in cell wall biosynthesis